MPAVCWPPRRLHETGVYRLAQVLLFLERLDYLRLVRAYEEKMLAATMDQLAQSQ
jgi:hypothetical protein